MERMRLIRSNILLTVLLVFLALSVGCGKHQPSPPVGAGTITTSYRLACMVPETGNLAFIGQPIRSALSLASEELRDRLAEAGVKIELIFADTQGNPREAVTQFNRVADIEKANGIVTTLAGVISAISPMAVNRGLLFMALTPDPAFLQKNPNGLRILSSLGGARLAETIKARGYKKVLVLHSTDAATMYDVNQVMVPRLQEAGVELSIDTFDVGQRDFKSLVAKYAKGSWDCLVIHGFGSEQPYVAEACASHTNLKSLPLLLSLGAIDVRPELRSRLERGQFFAPAFLDGQSQLFADFQKKFSARFPNVPVSYSAVYAYDAFMLLAEALIRGQSVDPAKIKAQLMMPTQAFTQEYRFDANGDFHPDTVMLTITPEGRYVLAGR